MPRAETKSRTDNDAQPHFGLCGLLVSIFFDHRDLGTIKTKTKSRTYDDTRPHFGLLGLSVSIYWDHRDLGTKETKTKSRTYDDAQPHFGLSVSRSRGLFGHYFLFRTLSLTCVIFSRKPPSLAKFSLTRSRYL